jgi:hypothetical protein
MKLDDAFSDYKEQMTKWLGSLGISDVEQGRSDAENILGLTADNLDGMTSEECASGAFQLSQYALFIQSKANECRTFLSWVKQVFNKLPGDDKAKLEQWRKAVELRLTRIEYLARRIECMSQSLGQLSRSKFGIERK